MQRIDSFLYSFTFFEAFEDTMKFNVWINEEYERKNRAEFDERYDLIPFVPDQKKKTFLKERENLFRSLKKVTIIGCNDSKLDMHNLSPGCRICAEGKWSCLFINGICNCKCFYCPTKQDDADLPTTNSVEFDKKEDYVDYIRKFGFKGVSFSGGEPFLTYDKTLSYLTSVKKAFGKSIHTWLYTNGTKVTIDKLYQLRDAGLDEIRFDIGATNYQLNRLEQAIGIINTVTVEIPAIPEEFEKMKQNIRNMQNMGVSHLNLHQLRLTPHNFEHLIKRKYNFVQGDKVTVWESEITALKLLAFSKENQIELPINYCSFVYKNRYQKAAARKMSAEYVKKSYEQITQNGFIRSIALIFDSIEEATEQIHKILSTGIKENEFYYAKGSKRILCSAYVIETIQRDDINIGVSYYYSRILPKQTFRNYFTEVTLNNNRDIVVEKIRSIQEIILKKDEVAPFLHFLKETSISVPKTNNFYHIKTYELIPEGLQLFY